MQLFMRINPMAKTDTLSTVKSMTAFARSQSNLELGDFSWEVRSVNQRYFDG